uniref:Uncharacterized protein n=1 Tax=Cannabis sativa TaxID=3483 RepID=A0A803QNN2_CANSA
MQRDTHEWRSIASGIRGVTPGISPVLARHRTAASGGPVLPEETLERAKRDISRPPADLRSRDPRRLWSQLLVRTYAEIPTRGGWSGREMNRKRWINFLSNMIAKRIITIRMAGVRPERWKIWRFSVLSVKPNSGNTPKRFMARKDGVSVTTREAAAEFTDYKIEKNREKKRLRLMQLRSPQTGAVAESPPLEKEEVKYAIVAMPLREVMRANRPWKRIPTSTGGGDFTVKPVRASSKLWDPGRLQGWSPIWMARLKEG